MRAFVSDEERAKLFRSEIMDHMIEFCLQRLKPDSTEYSVVLSIQSILIKRGWIWPEQYDIAKYWYDQVKGDPYAPDPL